MSAFARSERQALCETLLAVGPDAPTLCEGWLTRDLAAHLVLRETRPVAAAGIVLPLVAGWTARVQRSLARQPWPELVRRVQDPPFWTPFSWSPVEEAVNLTENFVHHEDVLRAQPAWTEPRSLGPDYVEALWKALVARNRFFFRRSPVAVTLRRNDGTTFAVRQSNGDGDEVSLVGRPGELLLYAFGRRRQARVDVLGSEAIVAAFKRIYR
ncbi:MAG TPA: TIGR03085 family metal-binding protein [Jiangellaceae bacterium]